MNTKKYKQAKIIATLFIISIIIVSVLLKIYLLTVVSIFTGILFLSLVHSKAKDILDERELTVQEKAADFTYAVFTPTIGLGAFFLLIPSCGKFEVFSKGEFLFLESLGIIFAYLTLFLITLYAISYFFLNRKYGGKTNEK
jgi:uncharacterized membrane protein